MINKRKDISISSSYVKHGTVCVSPVVLCAFQGIAFVRLWWKVWEICIHIIVNFAEFFIVSLLLFLFRHKKVLIFHHFIDVELVVLLLKAWMHLTFLLLVYLRLFLLRSNSCHSELFCIAWPGVGVCSIGLLSKVLLVLKLEQWKLRNGPSGWACESLIARYFICKMVFRNIWYLR